MKRSHPHHGSSVTPSMALRDGGKVIEPWPAASPSPADATAAAAAARTRAEAPVVHMVCKFNCAITLRLRTPPEFTGQSQATAAGRGVRGRECARCRLMSVVGANVGLLAAPRACAHTCTWICAAHARAHACRVRGLPAGPGAPTTLTHAGSAGSARSLGRGGFFPTSRLARERICVHNCEPVRVTSATRLGGLFASHIKKFATRMGSEKRHHPSRPSNSDGTEIWHHPSRI